MNPTPITPADFRRLCAEGCNVAELAAYTGKDERTVEAWIARYVPYVCPWGCARELERERAA
jgi:hypothetical protein